MPPEQRRAAIIEATIPLLQEQGTGLTTKQVAEAAGVAEGTIFRVFDSLQDLIEATVIASLSAHRISDPLSTISLGADLAEKTHATLELIAARITTIRSLMVLVHGPRKAPHHPNPCIRDELDARRIEMDEWLTAQFQPHESELTCPVGDYVNLLSLLAMGNAMNFSNASRLGVDDLATFALHGALRKDVQC